MFSKKFKSDNSLERFEIDDMLSAIKDVQKANKDIHTKRKRGRPVVKEQQKHDEAVRDLIEAFGEWYNRLYCEAKETTPIQTVTGVEIRSDPQAQHAIRKLYDHLKLRKNPVSMDDETWLAKLVELSKAFTSLLLQPSAPDPYSPETWVPEDWEDLPFQSKCIESFTFIRNWILTMSRFGSMVKRTA